MVKVPTIVVLMACFLLFYSGCENPVGYNYTIKEKTDMSNLLVFYYGSSIFGIDTTDFSVKGHIRVDDMSFGGVAKLPSGGIAFTHHRRASNNAWGNTLYVTDNDCNLLSAYEICYSPMSPKVINNKLLVGSSMVEPGARFKFQIYDTDNFTMQKEYLFHDMLDAWQIIDGGNKAYLGIHHIGYETEYSYIVELDLNTLDTTIIGDKTDFFLNAHLTTFRQDTLLYIFNVLEKNVCIYNLCSNSIILTGEVSQHPAIIAMHADRLTHAIYYNGFLYGKLELDTSGGWVVSYMVKLNPNTLEYVSHKKLDTPKGYTSGAHQFYTGRFLVMQFIRDSETQIVFFDIETGNIEHEVTLSGTDYDAN